MAAPQSREMIATLRQDPIAREILNRVNSGPYVNLKYQFGSISLLTAFQGHSGRQSRLSSSSTENFYAAVMNTEPSDDRRSRRQSRVSREIVSVESKHVYNACTLSIMS